MYRVPFGFFFFFLSFTQNGKSIPGSQTIQKQVVAGFEPWAIVLLPPALNSCWNRLMATFPTEASLVWPWLLPGCFFPPPHKDIRYFLSSSNLLLCSFLFSLSRRGPPTFEFYSFSAHLILWAHLVKLQLPICQWCALPPSCSKPINTIPTHHHFQE